MGKKPCRKSKRVTRQKLAAQFRGVSSVSSVSSGRGAEDVSTTRSGDGSAATDNRSKQHCTESAAAVGNNNNNRNELAPAREANLEETAGLSGSVATTSEDHSQHLCTHQTRGDSNKTPNTSKSSPAQQRTHGSPADLGTSAKCPVKEVEVEGGERKGGEEWRKEIEKAERAAQSIQRWYRRHRQQWQEQLQSLLEEKKVELNLSRCEERKRILKEVRFELIHCSKDE